MTDQYPSNLELRRWAAQKRPDLVQARGALPKFVIVAWNRTYPDRPYVKSQAYHGTPAGYGAYACRCERCRAASAAYFRERYRARAEDEAEEMADVLLSEWTEQ